MALGLRCLLRVLLHWRALWDAELTAADAALAREASYYLLIPPTVALHELGHAAAIWAQGGSVLGWGYLGYLGWVQHASISALGDFAVALAGNLSSVLIALAALWLGLRRPGHPTRNLLLIEVGRQTLFLVLVFYPLLCLVFPGDFQRIYDFRATPLASAAVATAHAAGLYLIYLRLWPQRWRPRAALLSSRRGGLAAALERRLALDPDDHAALRELGLLSAAAGDDRAARPLLEAARAALRPDAQLSLAYGSLLERAGEHAPAVAELERALQGLLRPEDRLAAIIPLVRALRALGRTPEASRYVEEIAQALPRDPRARELRAAFGPPDR